MSDPSPSKPSRLTREIEPLPAGRNLPRSGCYVFIALGVVLLGLTSWGVFTMIRQDQAIGRFTTDHPAQVAVAAVPPQAVADDLVERFRAFADGDRDQFEVTLEELNQAIATFAELEDYRGVIEFTELQPDAGTVAARVSLTLNQARFWLGHRYLNGRIDFRPLATDSGLQLVAADLSVPNREVDPGFIGSFGTLDWLGGFRDDDQPLAKRFITRAHGVEITATHVRILAGADSAN